MPGRFRLGGVQPRGAGLADVVLAVRAEDSRTTFWLVWQGQGAEVGVVPSELAALLRTDAAARLAGESAAANVNPRLPNQHLI